MVLLYEEIKRTFDAGRKGIIACNTRDIVIMRMKFYLKIKMKNEEYI